MERPLPEAERFSGPDQSRSSTRRTRGAASKNSISTLSPIFAANALKERRSRVRLLRLADLPTPLLQLARPRDLLGEGFGLAQANYRSSGVPLVKDRQGAQVRHTIPSVRLCALGEAAYLFSGEVLVPFPQQRLDLVVYVDAEQRVEERAYRRSRDSGNRPSAGSYARTNCA